MPVVVESPSIGTSAGQLRENAELACDAWVVSSIESAPQGRRAYAEALLSVCESLSAKSQLSSPILSMDVTTGDRRFLERRLTMILRDHRPFRLSRVAIALLGLVFAATLPAWTLRATPTPAPAAIAAPQEIPLQVEAVIKQPEIGKVQVQVNPQIALDQQALAEFALSIEAADIVLDRHNRGQSRVLRMSEPTFTHELRPYRGLMGQTIHLHLRGSARGAVWGTDVYTDDSDPNAAAVHAGLLKVGEEGIAAIRLLPGAELYQGTARNGVRSDGFGPFKGSYRFEGVQPVAKLEPS
jgi:hypothetical protein